MALPGRAFRRKVPRGGATPLYLLAERGGFEPPDGSPRRRFSKPVQSTALPPLLGPGGSGRGEPLARPVLGDRAVDRVAQGGPAGQQVAAQLMEEAGDRDLDGVPLNGAADREHPVQRPLQGGLVHMFDFQTHDVFPCSWVLVAPRRSSRRRCCPLAVPDPGWVEPPRPYRADLISRDVILRGGGLSPC